MSTMKNLVIRPADVSLNPLGASSSVADARVSVVYDRDVWVGGQPVPRVPLVSTSIPAGGLRVPVLASDDPSITEGAGFVIQVVVETTPRIGQHNDTGTRLARTIRVVAADPDVVPLGSKPNVIAVPDPAQYADIADVVAKAQAAVAAVKGAKTAAAAAATSASEAATAASEAATAQAAAQASSAAASEAAATAQTAVAQARLSQVAGGMTPFYAARDRHFAPITYWWADYYATPSKWDRILEPSDILGPVIINNGNGPGSSADPDWLRQAEISRSRGTKVIGYVSTAYGARAEADILSDIAKHVDFYHADGIFLDEMTNGIGDQAKYIPAYRALFEKIKAKYGASFFLVGNPGTSTTEDVLSLADVIMVYESDADYYLAPTWDIHPSYYSKYPRTKFWHVVHSVRDREQALSVIEAASKKYLPGFLYLTDLRFDAGKSNPYAAPPAEWLMDIQVQWARHQDPARIQQRSPMQPRPSGLRAADAGLQWWDDSTKRVVVWSGTEWAS